MNSMVRPRRSGPRPTRAGSAAHANRRAEATPDQEGTPASAAPITLDQLHVLVTVADRGSFSSAARALRRAQSAVSYAVATLERQLGVALFDRRTRKPTLTAAGQALLSDARAALREVGALVSRARGVSEGLEPRLSLAVSAMFPTHALVDALAAFRARFPGIALELHTEALGGVVQRVLEGVVTVAVSEPLPLKSPLLSSEPFGAVPFVHTVSAGHPLAHRRGTIPAPELERHVQIVLSDRSRLTAGRDFGVGDGPVWRVSDLTTKLALIRAGLGWGGLPRWMVEGDLARRRLARVRPDLGLGLSAEIPLFSVRLAATPLGPGARWLMDRLAGSLAGRPSPRG